MRIGNGTISVVIKFIIVNAGNMINLKNSKYNSFYHLRHLNFKNCEQTVKYEFGNIESYKNEFSYYLNSYQSENHKLCKYE